MDVPLIGLGLGVTAHLRTVSQSIVTRIENYSQGPETFRGLRENLALLTHNIDEVDNVLAQFPNERLALISPLFENTLDDVRVKLHACDSKVENELSTAFAGSCMGCLCRLFRATALSKNLVNVEARVRESSNQIQHISTVLAGALNALDLRNTLIPKIESLSRAESASEDYRHANGAPAVSHSIKLDFQTKDNEGEFVTPEGSLKHQVLLSISSKAVTVAAGALNPAYGVVGMAGVGKTVALQGLAGDEDIRSRFPDGIHYMSLGQGATVESIVQEIALAMAMTGASASVTKVENSNSLRKAVAYACTWFQGKKCLFLIDDLWPTDGCPTGHLSELRQLLRQSPDSRMVISTRSVNIALGAGSVVDFGAREPLGAVSVGIFMKYAAISMDLSFAPEAGDDLYPSMAKILAWCGGLPIALSVTGSAIALLLRNMGSLEQACDMYASDYEERATKLGEEKNPDGVRLRDGILLSLKYLQAEFSNWKERKGVEVEHTIFDLYTSLCILTNQLWVPVSALSRMWKLDEKSSMDIVDLFCGMSLANRSFRKTREDMPEKAGITIHDLHLEFCKKEAVSKKSESLWHSELLSGFLESSADLSSLDVRKLSSQQLLGLSPRSWWCSTVPEDGYIHANLSRHLAMSSGGSELAALLVDARWAHVRGKLGGILGLKADFGILDNLLRAVDSSGEEQVPSKCIGKILQGMRKPVIKLLGCDSRIGIKNVARGIQESAKLILKAMQLSWGSFYDGQRAFHFQLCGRLLSLRKTNVLVDAVMKSFEAYTPKPHLLPVSHFFPELNSAQILEIPVRGFCGSVACSACGRYVAAGGGHNILIADAITGDVLKRLKGHSEDVQCIRFTVESKKIVSASEDGTVAVWEWEKSDVPILVLEGHSDRVMGVGVSRDGERIISASYDRTLRFWNGTTGLQFHEFAQSGRICCLALCPDDTKVAIGLENGTVKALDSYTGEYLFENTEAHTKYVFSVAFSPDGQLLATSSMDGTIRLWNADTWAAIGSPVDGHTHGVTSVAFSPDGRQLVSGSFDSTVRLWDIATEESGGGASSSPVLVEINVFSTDMAECVTFTSDGERIVSGSYGGNVRSWDAGFVSEEKQRSFGHNALVSGVSISPDGLRVASGPVDKTVRVWNTQTGSQIEISLEGHLRDVNCVSFSPDGRHLVSGSDDKTLRMWDTEKNAQIGNAFEGHSDWVRCVSFSSDGLRIISGGDDKTVRLWYVETREQIGYPLIGHSSWIKNTSESSDGRFVVSRDGISKGEGGETIIWNRRSSEIVWRSTELEGETNSRITSIEAESIIRSCGQHTPLLWPSSFPEYTAEMYSKENSLYSNVHGGTILLGNLPSYCTYWKYDGLAKVFAAGLDSGDIAICRLIL